MAAPDPMRVGFVADAAYLPHAATMLESLLSTNAHGVDLHLVHGTELPDDDASRLERWLAGRGALLTRHAVPPDRVRDFPERHFPRSVWYRTLLADLLPDLPRMLYLDADTLVLDDLRPLWQTPLDGKLFAAVTNPLYPFMENFPVERLGLPHASRYLNSGVLLLDLQAMRREGIAERLRAYAVAHPENQYPEQDALSALFHERCRYMHPRWNVQTTLFDLAADELPFEPAVVDEARRLPAIAHFIGPFKPDHYLSRHPYGADYRRLRNRTPWPLAEVCGRTSLNFVLRRVPMVWQYRYFVWRAAWQRRR